MARDARYYFELGFEHGYQQPFRGSGDPLGMRESYPERPAYKKGFAAGRLIRDDILNLAPSISANEVGCLTIEFRYALNDIRLSPDEANPA